MSLKLRIQRSDFKASNLYIANRVKETVITAFSKTLNEAVIYAKNSGNYTDRTGALRASIGYAIYDNGNKVISRFDENVNYSFGYQDLRKHGKRKGIEYVDEIAKMYPSNGIIAVLVAGMDYALYVEARNFAVLTHVTGSLESSIRKNLGSKFTVENEQIT